MARPRGIEPRANNPRFVVLGHATTGWCVRDTRKNKCQYNHWNRRDAQSVCSKLNRFEVQWPHLMKGWAA